MLDEHHGAGRFAHRADDLLVLGVTARDDVSVFNQPASLVPAALSDGAPSGDQSDSARARSRTRLGGMRDMPFMAASASCMRLIARLASIGVQ